VSFRFAGEGSEENDDTESESEDKAVAGVLGSDPKITLGSSTQRLEVGLGYDSVGGLQNAIQLMRELVELPLRFPELWTTAGVPTPKGVLLHG
jgi:transitional endoplasmic reticulum ATPase